MKKQFLASAILASALTIPMAEACTNVIWDSPQGVVVNRTMDWMESTRPLLLTVRKGEERNFHGMEGLESDKTYAVKHNYLGIAAYGIFIGEGVNEHGLSRQCPVL